MRGSRGPRTFGAASASAGMHLQAHISCIPGWKIDSRTIWMTSYPNARDRCASQASMKLTSLMRRQGVAPLAAACRGERQTEGAAAAGCAAELWLRDAPRLGRLAAAHGGAAASRCCRGAGKGV